MGRVEASTKGEKGKGAWDSQDLIIEAGMVFELEPNAQRGKHRVNIGGTVVVTESGVKELNALPTHMLWSISAASSSKPRIHSCADGRY